MRCYSVYLTLCWILFGCEPTPTPEQARTMIIGGVPVAERDYQLPKDAQPIKKIG